MCNIYFCNDQIQTEMVDFLLAFFCTLSMDVKVKELLKLLHICIIAQIKDAHF